MQTSYDLARNRRYNEVLSQVSVLNDVNPLPCFLCRQPACHVRSHRDYTRRWMEQQRQRQLRSYFHGALKRGIHDERADPFARHPIIMTERLERLYSQLFTRWSSDFKGPERHLFPYSRYAAMLNGAPNDKALFLGLLSMLATQMAIIRDGTPDEFALALQLGVVSAQRKALLKDGNASDARIATALCILCNSIHTEMIGDTGAGLEMAKVMLRQRGGIQYLGMDGVLADNFMYLDHLNSILHNKAPNFAVPQPYLSSPLAPKGKIVYRDLQLLGLLSETSAWTATLFSVLVQIYETAAKGTCEASNKTYFAYLANVVEYQLSLANAQHHDTNTLDECLILGLVLFNHTVFRNSRDLAPSILIYERRFWRSLRSLRNEAFFQHYKIDSLEYYLTCIGSVTSLRRPSFYQTETIEILATLRDVEAYNMGGFDRLCAVMEDYGWSETVCSSLYANLWAQSSDHLELKKETGEDTDLDVRLKAEEEL